MTKKLLAVLLCTVMVFSLVACGDSKGNSGDGAQGTIELKFSTAVPETSSWYAGATKFSETVEAKTNGKYKITIYPSDQLSGGNQAAGIELLQQGSTDIHLQDAMVWSSIAEKSVIACFPWLLPTYEDVDKYVFNGEAGQALKDIISESGCVCLGVGENGYRQVVNNRNPIHTPSDMTGLKMRVPGSNLHVNLLKYIGADPVTMSQSEVYTSLQQGAIEATENTLDLLYTQNTLEVVDNLTLWNYSWDPIFLSVSEKLWNSLSDEEKVIFEEAAEEAMAYEVEVARKTVTDLVPKITEEYPDLAVVDALTDEEINAFKKAVAPIYSDYRDSMGEELFAKFGYNF